ncbi:hypothetical protein LSH36_303g03030 [Paralvinella palmiformis]|uniref:C2H2-type domain-containing protein n=1 Tax=Paralvinella palmiformis TaxID=53620 RepID=A0AAD9JI83_9ANNE|nr:hypothetical protein LSH36_303g03030 [Paralvinella palmiformis]
MADQHPVESTTDPPTTETERAYRISNTPWAVSSGHLQAPVVSDARYHMPQATVSPPWGGSVHPPPLLSPDGYNSRIEPGHRTSIHSSQAYTPADIDIGENYGSAYHLDSFRRLGLGQGIGYRVSSAAHSTRPGMLPESYARTYIGHESYGRNYIAAYSDARTSLEPDSHYRTVAGQDDYPRTDIEQDSYARQTGSEFYLRGNPVGARFESGAGTNAKCVESTTPNSEQTPSTLSTVIPCNGMYTSSEAKIPNSHDAACYSGSGNIAQLGLTNLESASKSNTEMAPICDARASNGCDPEHESPYRVETAVELDPGSGSAHESNQSIHSGLEDETRTSSPRDTDENPDHLSDNQNRELEANCDTSGETVSTCLAYKDRSEDVTTSQKEEVHDFVASHPGIVSEQAEEHLSHLTDVGKRESSDEIRDLSEEMKNAVLSYKQEHQDSSDSEMVDYFSEKWHLTLNKDVITRILTDGSSELATDTNGKSESEDNVSEKADPEDEAPEMSSEMKKEIFLHKTTHHNVNVNEIANHFSERWGVEVTKEIVLNICKEYDHQVLNNAQDIKNSSEEEEDNTASPLYWTREKAVASGDDISEEASCQDGYDNSLAKLVPVTVEEAREGLMKAIAYFMATPSIADGHVQTLWNILHYLDGQDESTVHSEKDSSSDEENSPQVNYSELVNIKQEISEADCSADAAEAGVSENLKSENVCTSVSAGSCRIPKVRSSKCNISGPLRRKLTKKRRGASVKTGSREEKSPDGNEISITDVKVDVDQRLKCPECDDSFIEFTQLLDHITRHSEEKLILAHSCGGGGDLSLDNNSHVLRPRTRSHGRGRPRCATGDNSSQNVAGESKTGMSPKRRRRIKLQNCTLCGRQFNDYSNFRRHLRLHAGLKPHKCPTCGVSFIESNALKKHMRTHTGEKPYLCTTCGKRVTTLAGLQSHARLHTGEKPFKCSVCGKDFAQSSSLKRHTVIHTGERPYGCPQCGKNFPRSEDLKMHIRTHTGQKPYKCLVCGKCFIKSSYLHKHARIHTGEKPYKCTTCGEAFAQSDILAKHIRVHTGERPYCCTVCGKTFTQSGSLYHHMKMHKQHHPNQQRKKVSIHLPEEAETKINNLSESVTTSPEGEHLRFPALSHRLSNNSAMPQMSVFPDTSRHYLNQWRPY